MSEETIGAAEASAPLKVVFRKPDAGWIDIDVAPLTEGWGVSATHLTSHFNEMLRWLEAILNGSDGPRWIVDGETSVTHFIYVGESDSLVGDSALPGLLVFQSSIYEPPRLFGFHVVDRPTLVRTFYEAFKVFTGAEYEPSEWESYDDETGAGWQGEPLQKMRSTVIEEALHSRDEYQTELKLGFPRARR